MKLSIQNNITFRTNSNLLLLLFFSMPLMANVFKTEVLNSNPQLQYVSALETLDFNNDGNDDFISVSSDLNGSKLWIGDGDGHFSLLNHVILDGRITTAKSADFNSDGYTDILLSKTINVEDETGKIISTNKTVIYFGDSQNSYTEIFEFDEFLIDIEIGDTDNDGWIDIVYFSRRFYDRNVIIYKNSGNNEFHQTLPVVNIRSSFVVGKRLVDMDNDGDLDILANFVFGISYGAIYYNDGKNNFSPRFVSGHLTDVRDYYVTDVNNDNLMDIVLISSSYRHQKIFLNKGSMPFELVSSDIADLSWVNGLHEFQLFDFKSILVEDLDNDGREDVIGISKDQILDDYNFNVRVRMHEKNNRIEYYNNTEIVAQKPNSASLYLPKITSLDFNNDGLKDLIVSGDSEIKLLTQTSNPKIEDIYYASSHVGHGYSIEKIGRDNLYYTVFYSYDETGNSEWFIQLNTLLTNNNDEITLYSPAPRNNDEQLGNLVSYIYDYTNQTVIENPDFNKKGYLQNSTNPDNSESLNLDFYFNNETKSQNWNSNRLIAEDKKPENDFSGLWWAGDEDTGWGLSLNFVQRIDQVDVFAILYFYDAAGQPRWITGQAPNFLPSQPLTIEMEMYNGYGRENDYVELLSLPSGNITIKLNQASKDFDQAGTMSMDVFYPIGERQNWIRNNIPFALSSEPRSRK